MIAWLKSIFGGTQSKENAASNDEDAPFLQQEPIPKKRNIFVEDNTRRGGEHRDEVSKPGPSASYFIIIPVHTSSANAGKRMPSEELTDVDLRIVRNVSDDEASVINATWEFARRNQVSELAYGSYNQFSPVVMLNGLLACELLDDPEDLEWTRNALGESVMTSSFSRCTGRRDMNLRVRAAYFLAALGELTEEHAEDNDHPGTTALIREIMQAGGTHAIAAIAARVEGIATADVDAATKRLDVELKKRDQANTSQCPTADTTALEVPAATPFNEFASSDLEEILDFLHRTGLEGAKRLKTQEAQKLAISVWEHSKHALCRNESSLLDTVRFYVSHELANPNTSAIISQNNYAHDRASIDVTTMAPGASYCRVFRIWRVNDGTFLIKAGHDDLLEKQGARSPGKVNISTRKK